MKASREELEQYLLSRCKTIALDLNTCKDLVKYINENYNVPAGMSMDMITRGKFSDKSDKVLFYLLDGILTLKGSKKQIDDFFTDIEIKNYSSSKLEKEQIKFPIIIKCLQVADDQWIGTVDTKFFMKLREAQLINYNENAQRTLTRVNTRDGGEYFKITLNESAISSLRASYKDGSYIPTPITLNIPEDSDAEFYYDKENYSLVIKSLKCFDISDGYHRYIAMCRENDLNPDFNQPWELRIINFTDSKTNHFIYQEDQKTRMTKADSNTMNQRSPVNRAVNRLNDDSSFCLYGEINNNGGKINKSEFTVALEYFYFKGIGKKEYDSFLIRQKTQEIKNKFNYLDDNDSTYSSKKYTYSDILITLFVFAYTKELENLDKFITYMSNNIGRIDKRKMMLSKGITRSLETDLLKLYKEVL